MLVYFVIFRLLVSVMAASSRRRNISAAAVAELLQDSGSDISDDFEDYRVQSVSGESSSSEESDSSDEVTGGDELIGKDGTRWRKC